MRNEDAAKLLSNLDLGSVVAETDNLLESARVETSVFDDLLADRVDLILGTKGSGKTALYRIFVDFLPDLLLKSHRVVIAHGVRQRQDSVFLAYKKQFDRLSEDDFTDFWCVYLISLAYEQFVRSKDYKDLLLDCSSEIAAFRRQYREASIPEFERKKSLKEIIGWTLEAVKRLKPSVTWTPQGDVGQFEFSLGDGSPQQEGKIKTVSAVLPPKITELSTSLEDILVKAGLSLWLMVDQLDELFERRSKTEQKALRGLLKAVRLFKSENIRVKIFLRDDILEQIVAGRGFTALSHITARSSDTLRWSEEQILTLVVRRIFSNEPLSTWVQVDERLYNTSIEYQKQLFYNIFTKTVYRPPNQSTTLRWIYNHTKDGRGVVTPRDVIHLLDRARQKQIDIYRRDLQGETDRLIHGVAVNYGLEELSQQKRSTYLEAEFPDKWKEIRKLIGGGTEYSEKALIRLFGKKHEQTIEDLISLGIIERATKKSKRSYKIPFLYRRGLECTQKFVSA